MHYVNPAVDDCWSLVDGCGVAADSSIDVSPFILGIPGIRLSELFQIGSCSVLWAKMNLFMRLISKPPTIQSSPWQKLQNLTTFHTIRNIIQTTRFTLLSSVRSEFWINQYFKTSLNNFYSIFFDHFFFLSDRF